ncbi:glycosyltransferase [Salinarchaeum laminariae]|uniref:glycosyltransferase n=1 Tax=Salinarchaeum laminariae TaxID=869888 RepID=UPI0020BFFF8A|nr:glycosyltransferase [Salinarchaeum laminariae]
MRIGFFTDSYFPEIDGVTYTIQLWRERLEAAGHEVYVVYPDGDYEPDEREIPVHSLPNPFYAGYRLPTFRRPSTLPDLDVVHCHGPASVGVLGRYYARQNDLPAIYTHHTPVEEYFHQGFHSKRLGDALGKLYVPYENALLGTFDVVTASTSRIDRDVEHVELPVGIDMEFFQPRDGDWFDDEPVIGYSGRVSNEKNVGELLRLAEVLEDYRFVIVGEGPYRDRLEARAPDTVEFRDFLPREQLPGFLSSLSVFVTASTADTLGLSTLEANACGTPVAAADVPPFDDTIGAENGRRFPYGDVTAMADAVEDCLQTERDTRGAVERFSVTRTMSQLESIYRDAAGIETPEPTSTSTETPASSSVAEAGTD